MTKHKEDLVLHIYIGNDDIQEWTQGIGKHTLMPAMFECCKTIVNEELEKLQFARVECSIRSKKRAFDFFVELAGISDTIDRLMEWALEEEKYEMCSEIKKLQEEISKMEEF